MTAETQIKADRREARTLGMIREAFLDLLKKKPIEKISIGELCEKANVHRSTFYRHYTDIYALMDCIYDDAYHEIFTSFASTLQRGTYDFDHIGYNMILAACTMTEQKQKHYRMLLFSRNSLLIQRLADGIYELYLGEHIASYTPGPELGLHYRYLTYGIIGVWSGWIRDGCKVPKEQVARAIKKQMDGFFTIVSYEYGPPEGYNPPGEKPMNYD
ncbi:MAG: TetR/AcrR family transcriptional regulator [Acetatifactor sp.]|nr:TetR/AcrR family transcriptional regulator [Acetatifactor sp.]MDE7353324.1 TetR/AcrR family transcriptional regulator [Acetatifactor sp.]